jgi:hypothetical protein
VILVQWEIGECLGISEMRVSRLLRDAIATLQNDAPSGDLESGPRVTVSAYSEIAARVKEICERYRLPYNTGPFLKQLGMVQRTILRLAFPGGKPRPKPGPYRSA